MAKGLDCGTSYYIASTEDSIKKVSFLDEANTEAKRAYNLYPKDAYKETWDSIQAILSTSK